MRLPAAEHAVAALPDAAIPQSERLEVHGNLSDVTGIVKSVPGQMQPKR